MKRGKEEDEEGRGGGREARRRMKRGLTKMTMSFQTQHQAISSYNQLFCYFCIFITIFSPVSQLALSSFAMRQWIQTQA